MGSNCFDEAIDPKARSVVEACEAAWPELKGDCNKFLKAVAQRLGITDFQVGWDANAIITKLGEPLERWTVLKAGDAVAARDAARGGNFVVGGLLGSEMDQGHGHVVVVTSGNLMQSGADAKHYPRGYWGRLHGEGKRCEHLNYAFRPGGAEIHYFSRALD